MVRLRRSALAAGTVALLALPSTAAAQSATASSALIAASSSGNGSNAAQWGSGPPAGSASTSSTVSATGARLPSTGADAGMIAAFGLGLVCTGLGLRLRVAAPGWPTA